MTDRTTVHEARKSALIVGTVFGLIAVWQVYRAHQTAAQIFAVVSLAVFVCAAVPQAALWFHEQWMRVARALGFVNSRILLSIVYYLMLTPIGLVVRLAGHDPLERRKGRGTSYWKQRTATRQTRDGYERSF